MTLLQGDCLELMKDIPDESVDMVLCDLPYGTTRNKWDHVIPFEPLWEQYRRICKRNAAIVLFSQQPFTTALASSNLRDFRYEIVWKKSQATGYLNANRMPMKIHENILVFYRRLPVYHPQKTAGGKPYRTDGRGASQNYGCRKRTTSINTDGTRYPVDVIHFPACNTSTEKPVHPTQKPVPLLEYLIRTYTDEGAVVLDNCMGSGSTGVACVNTGRDFIGMDLDTEYFDIAKRRIKQAQAEQIENSGVTQRAA